ncbi:MAG TPA: glycosyltransferase, partial [Cyclobacteriaceae bacterium]
RDQINGFSKLAEVFTIHSGRLPERSEDGALLSNRVFWILHKIVKGITGNRNNFFGNYGIKKFLQKNRIEVVLSNYGISAAHLSPICKELRIPLLVIFHGHDATDQKLLKQYKKKYQSLFKDAATIIVVSNDMKTRITSMGASSAKVEVVPCGVDLTKFKPLPSNKIKMFLAVGRFVPKKGPLYTIRAFNEVWKKYPETKLIMVGAHKGLQGECAALVNSLGMNQAVEFPGILKQSEISDLMSKAVAFVQHSVTAPNGDMEGTPVSIMEAGASGLPIISTLHGGIKDAVIHEKTGFLVEERDVSVMATYMMKLLEEPELGPKLGSAGRQHTEVNYNQSKQVGKLFELAKAATQKRI